MMLLLSVVSLGGASGDVLRHGCENGQLWWGLPELDQAKGSGGGQDAAGVRRYA